MKLEKVVNLMDNGPLSKVVKKCILEAHVGCFEVFVKEYKNTSYDIEVELDFGKNVLSILTNGEWVDKEMIPEMEKLLNGEWKWENLKLSNGSFLIITEDDDFNTVINILTDCNIEDGSIEFRHWALPILNENISVN
jgi:hypothetical protein